MSCILQHTPLLISDGLYQQLNYSPDLVTSSAFIGTVEDLERSVTLQNNRFYLYIDSGMTQHDTATSRTFLKVTTTPSFFILKKLDKHWLSGGLKGSDFLGHLST